MESTKISLPPELPYPITISSLHLRPSAEISRGVRLLTYSYTYVSLSNSSSETRFETWDSPVEGTIDIWKIKPGDVISQQRAKDPVVLVKEPCKHGMQVGGLCSLCGRDMTDFDYTGFSNASRANIQMTHSARGPTVSLEEAQRFERETAAYLLKSRKLSLIVDLDQTIVHATVDPTVGEWIAEGETWDAKLSKATDGEVSDSEEDVNPNWDALRDVKKFRLGTEGVAPRMSLQGHKGKERFDAEGCMYYIKPRPGLSNFLHRMSEKYEMHVYTMGTRAYAEAVCAALDPEGSVFGGRILSRDESGSLTQKSLQRLFPCDTSMVVIIDDRADVWEWSPNLLKVRPYDFFVGIGDINSAFLPKAPSLVATPPMPTSPRPDSRVLPTITGVTPPGSTIATHHTAVDADAAFVSQNQMTIERIAAQVEERPLAKKQEALLEGSAKTKEDGKENKVAVNGSGNVTSKQRVASSRSNALLKNDDTELIRVAGLLDEVHTRFFDAYGARLPDEQSTPREMKVSDGKLADSLAPCDVKFIIPQIRAETFAGVHILFSSVIPLDVDPLTSEIWRTAEVFGAVCHLSLSDQVTHVVAAKRGTAKVDAARRQGGIHVVWVAWFLDSLAHWSQQPEAPYLIDGEASPPMGTTPPSATLDQSFPGPSEVDELEEELEADGELITPDADIWADANAEVDAVLEEVDDESQLDTDDEGWRTDGSLVSNGTHSPPNPQGKKRARSSSVSESGSSPLRSRDHGKVDDAQSPLAKRKKLSASRRGSSRLKVGVLAEELYPSDQPAGESDGDDDDDDDGNEDGDDNDAEANSFQSESEDRPPEDQDASTSDDEVDDDDFLAREMAEELG